MARIDPKTGELVKDENSPMFREVDKGIISDKRLCFIEERLDKIEKALSKITDSFLKRGGGE